MLLYAPHRGLSTNLQKYASKNICDLASQKAKKKFLKIFHLPIDKVGKWCYTYTNLNGRQFVKKGEHIMKKSDFTTIIMMGMCMWICQMCMAFCVSLFDMFSVCINKQCAA